MEPQLSREEEQSSVSTGKVTGWKRKGILLLGVVVLAVSLGGVGVQAASRSEFCVSCHEIQPQYLTWQMSSHSTVSCQQCHIPLEWKKRLDFRLHTVKQLLIHLVSEQPTVTESHMEIDDASCLQCHSVNRRTTPSGDIKIPHETHMTQGVRCVECHSQVVHGKVAEKVTTLQLEGITTQDLHQHISIKDSRPGMNRCLECHTEQQVSITCETCHNEIRKPANHTTPEWTKDHGVLAQQNLAECNSCHSYTNVNSQSSPEQVRDYARGNVFCAKCHQQRPAGHGSDWRLSHKQVIPFAGGQWDTTGCLVCHNENKPENSEEATRTYCSKCHGSTESTGNIVLLGGWIRTHPTDWRQIHPDQVKSKGITQGRCFTCHENIHCSRCHESQRGPSPM